MHQMKPELQNYLVENLLGETFKETSKQRKEYAELMQMCQNISIENVNVKRTLLRLMRMETNRTLIRAFVSTLPEEKQLFLRLKYKEERELINISLRLHVSVSQLSIWSKNLIRMATQYVNYDLMPDDVFLRKKVINMLEIIASNIKCVHAIDPDRQVVDLSWLNSIEVRYNSYRKLLNCINNVLAHPNVDMKTRIVYLRLNNPYISKAELSDYCNIDKGTVSRYLIVFRNNMTDYYTFSLPKGNQKAC